MSRELFSTLRVVSLPTKTNFRGVTHREVALFKGEYGWGEFSPFLEYGSLECLPWLQSAIAAASQPIPKLFRNKVKVNGTIPALTDKSEIKEIIDSFPGVKTFKVKVGSNLSEDIARLAIIRGLGRKINIRIDVNGSWSVETALKNLYAMYEEVGVFEYVEQPCATLEELRELKRKINIPLVIAGDEILRKAVDPFAVDLNGAVDVLALKVAPLGGIERAQKLAAHHKLPIVVSSALESAVGISFGLKLAASFEEMKFDCGLGTGSLMAQDVAHLPIIDGEIAVADVDPEFEKFLVSPERHNWWQDRIMKTWELMA
jgi:O-succinylbenzoate synthase